MNQMSVQSKIMLMILCFGFPDKCVSFCLEVLPPTPVTGCSAPLLGIYEALPKQASYFPQSNLFLL